MTQIVERFDVFEHAITGKRLGRHVVHDPRSRSYPAAGATDIVSIQHARNVPIFDQGELGSCTGNAAAGMISTRPYLQNCTESDAVAIYSEATHLDQVRGVYPPDDTGSSGLAVMKALKRRGWITGYSHAFGLVHVLRALVLRPGITGISWREGCDNPDESGVVRYTGAVRGGHEVELIGIDKDKHLVWFANSWGKGWGYAGRFAMSFDDYSRALADRGDATFAV